MMRFIKIDAKEKIWVTRSSGGQYVNHFLQHNLAAIGHLDKFNLVRQVDTDGMHRFSNSTLTALLAQDTEMLKARRTSHTSQIRQFISEISVGDLIVTLDSSMFAVGRVAGFAYFGDSPLPIKVGRELKSLPYQLRIPVQWGPRFPRSNLPLPLERVFYSHRTVFEISEYWQYIYHLLYPVFARQDNLYLSLYIGQKNDIRTKDISQLLSVLSEIEQLAAELTGDQYFDSLTLKASFFSEGPFWSRLLAGEPKALLVAIAVASLVSGTISGGEIKTQFGTVKLDGILNTKAAEQFAEGINKLINRDAVGESVQHLRLHFPEGNSHQIDDKKIDSNNSMTIVYS